MIEATSDSKREGLEKLSARKAFMNRFVCTIVPVLLFGCSASTTSNVKDLAIKNGQNTDLLWVQSDDLVLGNCSPNMPPVQKNCKASQTRKLAVVQTKLSESIAADKIALEAALEAETTTLKYNHPIIVDLQKKVADADAKIFSLDQLINDQTVKIATYQDQIGQTSSELLDLKAQLAAVEARLFSTPADISLLKLRTRLLNEVADKDEKLNELSSDQLDAQNELAKNQQKKKQSLDKKDYLEWQKKSQWDSLVVSSPLIDQLQGQINGLSGELAAVSGLIELITDKGIAYREEDADAVQLRLLKKLKTILAEPNFVRFAENFDNGMPLSGFTFNSSNSYGRIQVVNGRLRMDVNSDPYALNEMILRLDTSGAGRLWLSFYHEAFSDEIEPLPLYFYGSAYGDGVSISNDGYVWYPVIDSYSLGSSGGSTHSISLDQQIDFIKRSYDANFGYGPNFLIKFQQYDDYSYPTDGREWDDIIVEMK